MSLTSMQLAKVVCVMKQQRNCLA